MGALPFISVVSPVYQAEGSVDALIERVTTELERLCSDHEIVLVDDGSTDRSWEKISENARRDHRIKAIRLTRNFGQHYALSAGLRNARGQYVVVLDCDLQDNPRYIPELLRQAESGFDIVFTSKRRRKHALHRNIWARLFFALFNWLSESMSATPDVGSYSLLSRKAVDGFLKINDVHRHYLLILRWLGYKHVYVTVDHDPRFSGRSSYTLAKLFRHALQGITSQSTRLLKLSIALGFAYFTASVIGVLVLITMFFISGFREGWASTLVVILSSTGTILIAIGVLGIYISNIFDQTRARPLYVIQDNINLDPPPQ